jgi:hypothetical protein
MFTIYLAPLTTLVGALMWGFSSNAKTQEASRIAFGVGLLVTLLQAAKLGLRL